MEEIRAELKRVVREVFGADVEVEISRVPAGQVGDYSSNVALKLAKVLGRNPREVAEEIAQKMRFSTEVAGPGFLNFILPDEYLRTSMAEMGANFEKNISRNEYSGKKVVCEFSDPNPFKVLHVGHLYTSMVGESISRLVECGGGEVIRANFGGDVGLHVAKNMYFLLKRKNELEEVKKKSLSEQAEFMAECYVLGTRAYEDDEVARVEITKLNTQIYEIAEKEMKEGEVAEIYWWGRETSYKYFEEFYASIGVKFDKFYPESTVAELGLKKVREQLDRGVYQMSEGAVVFKGEDFGLHTRVFINKEGIPTYETKDVGLIFKKYEDYQFDESVVITGNEQSEYMKVVLKSVEQYAPELVEKTKHLTHGMVRLPGNEKMSSRKGNFVKAVDVLESVKELVPEEKIALGAIRYAFLKYRIGGNIEFDAKESVSTTGNSGVYLQYSGVRARKVLSRCSSASTDAMLPHGTQSAARSASPASLNNTLAKNFSKLEPEERELDLKILEYKTVLEEAIRELAPHKIANYLYDLAQSFSRFYENVKVAGSEREGELARVVATYLRVLKHGLGLLGIEIPEEM